MRYRILDTPTGPFAILQHDDGSLQTTWIENEHDALLESGGRDDALLVDLSDRLQRYFACEVVDFSDVPTPDGPEFFSRCWRTCRTIPYGETRSYGELAVMAGGSSTAARAVGAAMRRNRLTVIIPCHRVIRASGRLGGFGGSKDPAARPLAIKRMLLELEQTGIRTRARDQLAARPIAEALA